MIVKYSNCVRYHGAYLWHTFEFSRRIPLEERRQTVTNNFLKSLILLKSRLHPLNVPNKKPRLLITRSRYIRPEYITDGMPLSLIM